MSPRPFPLDPELLTRLSPTMDGIEAAPADETIELRRLISDSRMSAITVVRLWRELAGERRRQSSAPAIAVHGGRFQARTAELARARFGCAARFLGMEKPETALAAARPPGGVAVIALDPETAWWLRLLAEPDLRVFAALPDLGCYGPRSALAVSSAQTGPTGADETYFVTDAAGKAALAIEALQSTGLAASLVQETGGLKLIALAGYVQAHDPRLDAAPGHLKGVIGASPLPLDL